MSGFAVRTYIARPPAQKSRRKAGHSIDQFRKSQKIGRIDNEAPERGRRVSGLALRTAFANLVCWRNY
jgi:hypothetical protein